MPRRSWLEIRWRQFRHAPRPIVGSVVTWLVVPRPRGSGASTTRSPWSAALGFFAAVPVCYLVLVVVVQILEPLFG